MLNLNEIHHGCCLDLMQDIPSGSVDMILCDLPYGTTACHWDTIIPFDKLWAAYERVIKPSGAIVLTASFPFTGALWASNPKLFRYEWVWQKDQGRNFQLVKSQPLKISESILVFAKGKNTYNPQGVVRLDKPIVKSNKGKAGRLGHLSSEIKRETYEQWYTGYPDNILRFKSERGLHPTQKPTLLWEYLIKTYTNPGEVVLDNCAGSATTAIAALNTGRQFICIEQEEKYVTVGRARVAALQTTLTF